jgi:hypothetical protein
MLPLEKGVTWRSIPRLKANLSVLQVERYDSRESDGERRLRFSGPSMCAQMLTLIGRMR